MSLLVMLAAMLAMIAIDVPIGVALGLVAVAAMTLTWGPHVIPNISLTLMDSATNFTLIAIPLFILAGAIMNTGGISRRLLAFVSSLVGFVRGGLAMVTIGSSMLLAEISGSAVAGVAALGSILIPAMRKRGYPAPFAAAVTSSASTLAVVIPPSLPMILYAVMSGSSVVELFVAGIVPGVVGGLLMMATAYWIARRRGYPVEDAFDWKRVAASFKDAAWALLLPLIVLGGIFSGWVTATEGAGLAVLAALLIGGLVYRELDWPRLRKAMISGGIQTAVVMLLVTTSGLLGDYLTQVQAPQRFAATLMDVTSDRWAILGLLNIFFLLIGMFLHSAAAIILVVPIVMPLVNAAGIDPVHFGLIVTLNLAVGQQTPPVASVLVTACSVAKTDIWDVTRENVWFIAVLLFVLLLMTYVPALPMSLVSFFYR
ncbi:MAG: TRAP transporter large permease subunit [Acidobacteria bacterium]|nr:TRAP transporter large permease subunit [Acidobacteriota bacterium]